MLCPKPSNMKSAVDVIWEYLLKGAYPQFVFGT